LGGDPAVTALTDSRGKLIKVRFESLSLQRGVSCELTSAPERWVDDALFRTEVRVAYRRLVEQGWTDALRALHPGERIYHQFRARASRDPSRR
jgi:hypothetical protein